MNPMVDGFDSIQSYMQWFGSSTVQKAEVWFENGREMAK